MRSPWLCSCLVALGCAGQVQDDDHQPAERAPSNPDEPPPKGKPGTPPAPPSACATDPLPRARVWRLSPTQYANTVAQLYGVEVGRDALPADGLTRGPFTAFDTAADVAVVHDRLAVAYRDEAARVASAALNGLVTATPCLSSSPVPRACAERFVSEQAARAFRRPADSDESRRLLTLFETSAGKWGGPVAARLTVQAILQSPRFLYRTELGDGAAGRVSLTAHELATQLAYLLTDSPPDASLRADADAGRLDAGALRRHAERLVKSDGARRKAVDFFFQYLHVNRLASGEVTKDGKLFPSFTPALRDGMLRETRTFLEKEIWEAGGLGTLFSAEVTHLDAALASHYGLQGQGRVSLPPERRGVLGHAAVLASLSEPEHTSPTHRGLFFLQNLLCQTVPDPPPDAADQAAGKIVSPDAQATQRQHFEYAKKNAPECTGCHARFMEMGLGLERFDAIGRYRESEHGRAIDPGVTLTGFGTIDGRYADGFAAARAMVATPAGQACFVAQVATYALGRVVDPEAERCEVGRVVARAGAGGLRLPEILVELTQGTGFFVRQNTP